MPGRVLVFNEMDPAHPRVSPAPDGGRDATEFPPDFAASAVRVVNQIPAMVAYWDANQRCVFANDAYREWFGRSPGEMIGLTMRELLGAIYEKNLPYILGALAGEKQVFERRIPLPNGDVRDSIATYTPDVVNGRVRGFFVHVADVTRLRVRESALAQVIEEAIAVLEKTKRSFRSKELGQLRERLLELKHVSSRVD
jgi:PAS domain S-box-containing protein